MYTSHQQQSNLQEKKKRIGVTMAQVIEQLINSYSLINKRLTVQIQLSSVLTVETFNQDIPLPYLLKHKYVKGWCSKGPMLQIVISYMCSLLPQNVENEQNMTSVNTLRSLSSWSNAVQLGTGTLLDLSFHAVYPRMWNDLPLSHHEVVSNLLKFRRAFNN